MTTKTLLLCGILASLLYLAMNVLVPLQWPGYSVLSQVVSELSAVGAPTRVLWVALGVPYTALILAFGFGVWLSAGGSRALRAAGGCTIGSGVLNIFWPPMHLRGAELTLTDTLHIVWSGAAVLLMLGAIVFGAVAFGRRFRVFSAVAVAAMIVFGGVLTGLDGPKIAADLPTPWVGLWERIAIAAYFVWLVAFATGLLRRQLAAQPGVVDGGAGAGLVTRPV